MDPDSLFSLFIIVLMIVMGAFFSATETAFSALNRVRMKSIVDEGTKRSKRAELVLRLHDGFDKLLSTLLILNNVVTLIAAAVSTLFFVRQFGEELGAPLSTVTLTVLIVFLGDLTPKSLAKESPEYYALMCAPLLNVFVWLCSPVNYLFSKWKIVLSRVITAAETDRMTDDELYSYVEVAQDDGLLDEDGRQLLDNAIEFKDLRAIDILTPRVDLVGISEDASEAEIARTFIDTEYSRLPVYRETIDQIVGVVHMRDFFKHTVDRDGALSGIFVPPVFVAPTIMISELFKQLQTQKSHFAIVADEYGGTAGIITLEDILEELVGDIWDESDEIIVEFEEIEEDRHKVVCSAYVKDLFSYLNLPEDPEVESTTVSGWIMDKLEKVPEDGDSFTFENLNVSVHKTENRRVLECIVTVRSEV